MYIDSSTLLIFSAILLLVSTLCTSYTLRVPPYAGIVAIIIHLYVASLIHGKTGEDYSICIMRVFEPITGPLNVSLTREYYCCIISFLINEFSAFTATMNWYVSRRESKNGVRQAESKTYF